MRAFVLSILYLPTILHTIRRVRCYFSWILVEALGCVAKQQGEDHYEINSEIMAKISKLFFMLPKRCHIGWWYPFVAYANSIRHLKGMENHGSVKFSVDLNNAIGSSHHFRTHKWQKNFHKMKSNNYNRIAANCFENKMHPNRVINLYFWECWYWLYFYVHTICSVLSYPSCVVRCWSNNSFTCHCRLFWCAAGQTACCLNETKNEKYLKFEFLAWVNRTVTMMNWQRDFICNSNGICDITQSPIAVLSLSKNTVA